MTKCDLSDRATFFASDSLLEEAKEKGANVYINLAYTSYGGTFVDNCLIQYFKQFYPESIIYESTSWNGENVFVFGEIAETFLDETKGYFLGFENFEDYFFDKEYQCQVDGLKELGYTETQIDFIIDNDSVYILADGTVDVNTENIDSLLNNEEL